MVDDPKKRYPNLKPSRRSVRYGTYDEWKLANPDDDLAMMDGDWIDWPDVEVAIRARAPDADDPA